ncbi:MAG: BRO family protein [Bacillota bacterium]|nr:BRO family protein [Bacillota bacterium]
MYIPKVSKIREKRIGLGLNPTQLSVRAGLPKNAIGRIEKNTHSYTHPLRAKAIADALSCKVDELFEEVNGNLNNQKKEENMNELKAFHNGEFGEVRTCMINNEVFFALKDVCRVLEIKNPREAKKRLFAKGVAITDTLTSGGLQKLTFINEANLYKLVFQSRKPKAKEFVEWVASEILLDKKVVSCQSSNVDIKLIAEIASVASAQTVTMMMEEIYLKGQTRAEGIEGNLSLKQRLIFSESKPKLKVENFPDEFKEELDEIFLQMKENEQSNFAEISKYCEGKGYPVSNVAIARYYKKNFAD